MKKNIKHRTLITVIIGVFSVGFMNSCFYVQPDLDRENHNDVNLRPRVMGNDNDANTDKTPMAYNGSEMNIQQDRQVAKMKNNLPSVSGKKEEHLYHEIIFQAASRHKIDPALVKAIIMAESGFNARATSKKGARGLMQLMPRTAEALGVEDAFNPHQNISGGVRYFKQLVYQFNGDVKLALAAYNAGSKNVRRYNGIPPFKSTQYYIKKVLKYYQVYKNQMSENIDSA